MSKAEQVDQLASVIRSIMSLHKHSFPTAKRQIFSAAVVPSVAQLTARFEMEAIQQLSIFQFRKRREARAKAPKKAKLEHARLEANAQQQRAQKQADHDRAWDALVANEPDAVLATLTAAFEDNEAAAAAVGAVDDAVSLVVEVPALAEVPDRIPGVTPAGNPSLRKASVKDRNGLYVSMVSGYMLTTVKEAFAVAPGIQRVNIVAVRKSDPDAYGNVSTEAIAAAAFTRRRLEGIRWEAAEAAQIINDANTELISIQRGKTQELMPIDLNEHPEVRTLVDVVNLSI